MCPATAADSGRCCCFAGVGSSPTDTVHTCMEAWMGLEGCTLAAITRASIVDRFCCQEICWWWQCLGHCLKQVERTLN